MRYSSGFLPLSRKVLLALVLIPGLFALGLLTPHLQVRAYSPPPSNRSDQLINAGWSFHLGDVTGAQAPAFDDSSWTALDLPHTWNNLDGQDGGNNYYRGSGWYRKHYLLPDTYSGRNIYLQFDGSNITTDLYVNGSYVGQHKGGYSTFRFDVTSFFIPGADSLIAVKVNNSYDPDVAPLTADYTFFGGIYRNVHLLITDKLQVTALDYGSSGVYLTPSNITPVSADVQITAKIQNSYALTRTATVTTIIVDQSGQAVQTVSSSQDLGPGATLSFVQNTSVASPHLWQGRAGPYLYRVYLEVWDGPVLVDLVDQPLGFRTFQVDATSGFFLNGQYLDLHGVSRHQDRAGEGWVITPAQEDQDLSLMLEMGVNTVRLGHYQHDQYFYSLADTSGLVVWAELPLLGQMSNSAGFSNITKQQLTEMLRQNYNHPSIMFWDLMGEVNSPAPASNTLFNELNSLAHLEDPTRLTTFSTYGGNITYPYDNYGWSAYPTDLIGFDHYFGWYYNNYTDFAAWADGVHAAHPTSKIAVAEYGAGASLFIHSSSPLKMDHSEEYQALFHETYWKAMAARPFLWAKYVWNMFDFASDLRREGDTAGRNDKGLVTYDRQTKKDAFYWYKANWSDQPFVYITGRHFDKRMQPANDLKIYSNTASVELVVNGQSLGSQTSADHIFTWSGVTLSPGSNQIQAIGTKGGLTYSDSVNLSYSPLNLAWTAEYSQTTANLLAISCPTIQICYAGGQARTVLKTTSSGQDWTSLTFPGTADLKTLACPDVNTCYALDGGSSAWITTDGGTTWQARPISAGTFSVLSCPGPLTCFAGDPSSSTVYVTTNGGNTWIPRAVGHGISWLACQDPVTCLLTGYESYNYTYYFLKTTDGGSTWQTVGSSNIYNWVACAGSGVCFAQLNSTPYLSINGGSTFNLQSSLPTGIKKAFCLSISNCFLLSGTSSIQATTNGGGTWVSQPTGAATALWDLSCPTPQVCYAVGDGGVIMTTVPLPPALHIPQAQQIPEYIPHSIPGISVTDLNAGNANLEVALSVQSGVISLTTTSNLTFTLGSQGQSKLAFRGGLADINAALDNLNYQGNQYFSGQDLLELTITDPNGGLSPLSDHKVISMTVLPALVVRNSSDNGLGDTFGDFSYALIRANDPNRPDRVITFIPGITRVTLGGSGPYLPFEVKPGVTIDGGACEPGGPALTLDGNGSPGDGLTVSGGVILKSLKIRGFGGRPLVAAASKGKNRLSCVRVEK